MEDPTEFHVARFTNNTALRVAIFYKDHRKYGKMQNVYVSRVRAQRKKENLITNLYIFLSTALIDR